MTNQMKEPIKVRELTVEDHRGMGWIENADGKDLACYGAAEFWLEENRDIGRRIVACVNYLAGISTQELEAGNRLDASPNVAQTYARVEAERDALREQVKALADVLRQLDHEYIVGDVAHKVARDALAKVKP